MSDTDKEPKVVVYIPKNAKINLENKNDEPPIPKYNKRIMNFDIEAIKNVTGGSYGKEED